MKNNVTAAKVAGTQAAAAKGLKVSNGNGGFYRFTASEVDAMKSSILAHIEGDGSAWRLRIALDGSAYCCECSKAEKAKRVRKIALYNALTDGKDMPKWEQPTGENFASYNERNGAYLDGYEQIKEGEGYAIPQAEQPKAKNAIERFTEVAENLDFSVDVDGEDIEIGKYSPAGQDFSVSTTRHTAQLFRSCTR